MGKLLCSKTIELHPSTTVTACKLMKTHSFIWLVWIVLLKMLAFCSMQTGFGASFFVRCCGWQGAVSLVYLSSSDMYKLINYSSFVNWLAIGLSVVALLYFRWKLPNAHRPIKVQCFVTFALSLLLDLYAVAVGKQ